MLALRTFVTLALVGLTCALPVDKGLATGATRDADPLIANGTPALANTDELVGGYMSVNELSIDKVASLLQLHPQDITSSPPPSRRQTEQAKPVLLARLVDVNIAMNILSGETELGERGIGLENVVQAINDGGPGGNINNINAAKSDISTTVVRTGGSNIVNNAGVDSVLAANLARANSVGPNRRANGILQEASAKGGNDPLTGDPIKASTQTSVIPQSGVTRLVDFLASKETTKRHTVADETDMVASTFGALSHLPSPDSGIRPQSSTDTERRHR